MTPSQSANLVNRRQRKSPRLNGATRCTAIGLGNGRYQITTEFGHQITVSRIPGYSQPIGDDGSNLAILNNGNGWVLM